MSKTLDQAARRWAGDRPRPGDPEPEVLPLSLAGSWIAWSSDGLRIVAYAKTLVEVQKLAHAASEPDPILEVHPGHARLIMGTIRATE